MSDKPQGPEAQLAFCLERFGIGTVLDVGANRGQYARRLRRAGYGGAILSIEPIPTLRDALAAEAAGDPLWRVAPALALGERDGLAELEVSAEDDMSSLLPQTELLGRISPSSRVLRKVSVPLRRLDTLLPELAPEGPLFLKLDVQGYEHEVLAGAAGVLGRIAGLQLEMALVPLYQGERSWRDTVDWAEAQGFALHLLIPGYFEQKLARQLQVDGVFFRPPA
jgi:FkbM family methyltransferase